MSKSQYIGALWAKESGGNKFLSGEVEVDGQKVRIVVFKNNRKEKETHPDYNILLAGERGSYKGGGDSKKADAKPKRTAKEEDDLPF